MFHQGERLTLGFEAGDHQSGIHAGLDDFERHLSSYWMKLLGQIDNAEPTFPDLFEQPVRSNDASWSFQKGRSF